MITGYGISVEHLVKLAISLGTVSISGSSSRTYRLTWHELNTIDSRTRYTNYREKN